MVVAVGLTDLWRIAVRPALRASGNAGGDVHATSAREPIAMSVLEHIEEMS
jgi:hypothetical protein